MKCIICFRPFDEKKKKRKKIAYIKGCNHEFCKLCIEKWYFHDYIDYNGKNCAKCPICRFWFQLEDITLKNIYDKKNNVLIKRTTRNDTKKKRNIELVQKMREYLNTVENCNNEEKCSNTCNKIFTLVYENKWVLYNGPSYNVKYLNQLGIIFKNKLIELYKHADRNIYTEIEVWRFKFHFLFN
jgi:hypothetical protein